MGQREKRFFDVISFPFYLVLSLWVVHLLKLTFNLDLGAYGVIARESYGFKGIFTSPFVHGSLQHLISNSVPLFVLTTMIVVFYQRVAYQSIFLIYLLTGLSVWLFSRPNVSHIGASGVVYGLVSFVFWTGVFRRNIKSIMLAMIVTLLYSGYFMGVLPTQKGISWESHLFGALMGIIVAFWFKNETEKDEIESNSWDNDEETKFFLPRDTFEKTREQRINEQFSKDEDWTSNIS